MNVRLTAGARVFARLVLILAMIAPLFVVPPAAQAQSSAFSLKVNFQSAAANIPSGYVRDYGLPFGSRSSIETGNVSNPGPTGYTYGWVNADDNTTPVDISVGGTIPGNGRDRNVISNQLQDTLMHMQPEALSSFNGTKTDASWKLQLPNDIYNITVSVGDPTLNSPVERHNLLIEGTSVISNFVPSGVQGDPARFRTVTMQISVSDGSLLVEATGGFNTKINYIEIASATALPRPYVTGVTPANNAVGVRRDTSITATVSVANGGIRASTVTNASVFLTRNSDNAVIPSVVNTTGGGDALTLVPSAALDPNTAYTFHVTDAVLDAQSQPFIPFTSVFTTGTAGGTGGGGGGIAFQKVPTIATDPLFSVVAIGPDNKLYAGTLTGDIKRYAIAGDGSLTFERTIASVRTSEGGPRAIIGMAFDPVDSTPSAPVLWVSHNGEYVAQSAPDWTGRIARLSGPDLSVFQNYVIGLPHSYKDHMTNSIEFNSDGDLFLPIGSNSAMGAADAAWGNRPERLMSAAVLRVNMSILRSLPTASLPINVKTEDGGLYDPYAVGAPVTIYATGVRNAYDLIWHSSGRLYAPTNGSAAGGATPTTPGTWPASCSPRKTDGRTYNTPVTGSGTVPITQKDWLFLVEQGGYYGHPNPVRCEWIMNGANPTAAQDPAELPLYPVGTQPDPNYRGFAYDFGLNKSPNGSIEYRSNVFSGALQGKLLVTRFSQEDDILVLDPSGPNGTISSVMEKLPGMTGFNNPLDLIEDRRNGNLYVVEHGPPSKITLLRPLVGNLPQISSTPAELVFNDVAGGAASPLQTITLRNDGTSTLNISAASLIGSAPDQFQIVGSVPTAIGPGATAPIQIAFNPSTAGPKIAVLRILSDAVNAPSYEIVLRGLGTNGTSGADEPSLQWVLDTFEIDVLVGDDDPSTNIINSDTFKQRSALLGEEVPLQQFERADNANPVMVQPIAVFGPAATDGSVMRFGVYPSGNISSLTELFRITNSPSGNNQRLLPTLQSGSVLSFDPGPGAFSVFSEWAFFGNRRVYSEDAQNTFASAIPHHVRFFPLRDSSGALVPNSYIVATEEHTSGFDYQDIVVIIRNVRPFGSGPTPPPSTPINVVADPGDSQVTLTWNPGSGGGPVVGYSVYRSLTPVIDTSSTPLATVSVPTYVDTGLTNGTTYYYSIKAQGTGGLVSTPTTRVSATPFPPSGKVEIYNTDRLPYNDRLVFNAIAVAPGGLYQYDHDTVVLQVRNVSSDPLRMGAITIQGTDADTFMVASGNGPVTIAATSVHSVTFRMRNDRRVSVGGIRQALAYIPTSDPAQPTVRVELAGAFHEAEGQDYEPSLQEIFDIFGYSMRATLNGQTLDTGGYPKAVGDEMISGRWRQASDKAPIYIRQIAGLSASEYADMYLNGGGCGTANCGIAHGQWNYQSLLPLNNKVPQTPTEIWIPSTNASFEVVIEGYGSNRAFATTPRPHALRFYPLRDRNGVIIQNSYIVGQDYSGNTFNSSSPNHDYQDNVYLITNIRPDNSANNLTVPKTYPGNPSLVLNFDRTYAGTLNDRNATGMGFPDTMRNITDVVSLNAAPTASLNSSLLNLNTGGLGTLTVTSSPGTISAGLNNQVNTLCLPFDARTSEVVLSTRFVGPLNYTVANHQAGLIFGPDYNTYVKFVMGVFRGGRPSLEFAYELKGASPVRIGSLLDIPNPTSVLSLELRLTANPATGTIKPSYSINGGAFQDLPDTYTLTGPDKTRFFDRVARSCLFSTHRTAAVPMVVTVDRFAVEPSPKLSTPRTLLKRYNIGGPTIGVGADAWLADTGLFSPGSAFREDPTGTLAIANTPAYAPQDIYQDYRGNVGSATLQSNRVITYELPIGTTDVTTVSVRLHFAELYWGVASGTAPGTGRRVFDTYLEGVDALPDFDVVGAAGGPQIAVVPQIENIVVRDGFLTIVQRADVDFASLAAVEIYEQPSGKPVANAGLDQQVPPNSTVTLSGSVIDTNPPYSFTWSQTAGPAVTLVGSGASVTFTAPSSYAILEFELRVQNGLGLSGTDRVLVTVGETPITGLSATNNGPVVKNTPITFSATKLTGDNVTYTWDLGNGDTRTGATVVYTYTTAGNYYAKVTATNGSGSAEAFTTAVVVDNAPWTRRINGGYTSTTPFVDSAGNSWVRDNTFGASGSTNSRVVAVANTIDDALYQTYRSSTTAFTYTIPVNGDGWYDVELHFAEMYWGVASGIAGGVGKRVMNINLEGGAPEFTNFDVWTKTNAGATAYIERLSVPVAGSLTVAFFRVTDQAMVSALRITQSPNQPPTANAGNDLTGVVNQLVTLDVDASDRESTTLSYLWTQVSGPTPVTLSGATTTNPSFVPPVQGTYTFLVRVRDGSNVDAFDSVNVEVTNRGPSVLISPPQTVDLASTVVLTSTGTDPDNDPLTYLWEYVSGPDTVTFSDDANQNTSFVPSRKGVYTLRVTVTDSGGDTATATTEVTVRNSNPTVNAGSDLAINVGETVAITSTVNDPDNDILTYLWEVVPSSAGVALTNANTRALSVTGLVKGSYLLRLTVNDGTSGPISDTLTLTVRNQAPSVVAGADQLIAVGATTTISAVGSDPDGDSLTYLWEQIAGPTVALNNANTANASFTAPLLPATLTFRVTVVDPENRSATDTITVVVGDNSITGLTVNASSPVVLGQTMFFTASIAAGSNTAFAWNFGDGGVASGATANHLFAAAGTYTVTVQATNSQGSVSRSILVSVTNQNPLANAGADQSVVVGATVTVDATGSSDPDGHNPLGFTWRQVSGPTVALSNANTARAAFVAPSTPTVLVFEVTVRDRFNAQSVDTVIVTVNDIQPSAVSITADASDIVLGQTVNFVGNATGSNLVYTWDFGNGRSATGRTVAHIYAAEGAYAVKLTVSNSSGETGTAMVGVVVRNTAPTADAGIDQNAIVGAAVTLSAGSSTDADGHLPLSFDWVQLSGVAVTLNNPTSATPSFVAPTAPMTLVFRVTVRDAYGKADSDTVQVFVSDSPAAGLTIQTSGVTTLGQSTYFTATASAGTNLNFFWDFGDGVTTVGATTNHLFAAEGSYPVMVRATNRAGDVLAAVVVSVVNVAPNINAGADQTVESEAAVSLAATASDPDGHTPLFYLWEQVAGARVTLSDTESAAPTFTAPDTADVLIFRVTVRDAYGKAASDTVQITVVETAEAPIVGLRASADSQTVLGQATAFSAMVAAGDNVLFSWTFGDGGSATGASVTHTYAAEGRYRVVVTAQNQSSRVSVSLNINVLNRAPVAVVNSDMLVAPLTNVVLDASGSSDPDGHTPLSFAWEQMSGDVVAVGSDSTPSISFTAPQNPGVLEFKLTVQDTYGKSADAMVVVTVVGETPMSGLRASGDNDVVLGQSANFQAQVERGTGVSFAWNFGDGQSSNGTSVSHTYAAEGVYTVKVQASDGKATLNSQLMVVVRNTAPTVDAGLDRAVVAGDAVTLNATAADPDGHNPLSFAWTQLEGPTVALSGAASANLAFVAPDAETTLIFQLTVRDAYNKPSSDLVKVVVAPNLAPTVNAGRDLAVVGGEAVAIAAEALDPDGHTPLTFAWVQTAGPTVVLSGTNSPNLRFVAPDVAAKLTFQLTVTDARGKSAADVVNVVVTPNAAPTVNAGRDLSAIGGDVVALSATASDPDGHTPLTFAWVQTAGGAVVINGANTTSISFTAPDAATKLTFQFTATDARGKATSDTVNITVTPNAAPTVNAGVDREVKGGTPVSLAATAADPDGHNPLTFAWVQTAGPTVALSGAASAVLGFTAPDLTTTLTFQLTVTDARGKSTSDSVTVRVKVDPQVPTEYYAFLPLVSNVTARDPGEVTPTPTTPTVTPTTPTVTPTTPTVTPTTPTVTPTTPTVTPTTPTVTPTTPTVTPTTGPDQTDLAVSKFELLNNADGTVLLVVEVENRGNRVADGFWVDLFINPNTPPTGAGVTWDRTCTLNPCYGMAWGVPTLAPGQKVTLTSTSDSIDAESSHWLGVFAEGTTDLYVLVDSWNGDGDFDGAFTESNEGNNVAHLSLIPTTPSAPAHALFSTGAVKSSPVAVLKDERRNFRLRREGNL